MAYNDYVILVDENGQPYIAHGERYQRFRSGLKERAHKYLEKFPNLYRAGATAYAYTEDQVRQMRNYARTGGRKAVTAAKKAAKYVDDHDAGITERIQARALEGKAKRVGKKDHDAGNELAVEAARLRRQGKSEYENSRLKKAADAVSKYGSTTLSAVKGAGTKAGSAVSGAASKASGSVKNAIGNARSTINDVIDRKITGATAKQDFSKATQNALMGLDGAMGEVADAQQALSKAIIGGNTKKIEAAQEALAQAGSNARSLLNKVGNVFTKSEKAAIESALNYELDPVTGEWVQKR